MPTSVTPTHEETANLDPVLPGRKVSLSSILDDPNLPSPPALALQIVDAASKPDCDLREVMNLLKQDPALCGKVLQTVNSSLFALPRPVASLDRAVMVLGLKPLRSLVLGLSLPALHFRDQDDVVLRYWQESVAGAVMARELAVHLRRREPDEDLISGLLRDIGVMVLRELFPDEYRQVWTRPRTRAAALCDAETEALSVNHTEVSAAILESWRLPPEIVEPVRCHHEPEQAEPAHAERAWLLYFASELAGLSGKAPSLIAELLQSARTRLNMDQPAFFRFLDAVTPRIRDFAAVLKVDIGKVPNFASIVAAGHKELVQMSLETTRSQRESRNPAALRAQDETVLAERRATRSMAAAPGADPSALPEFDVSHLTAENCSPARLDCYEVREALGRGAMGVVFKGYDPALYRFVAIKMLNRERLISSDARERFLREARASAAIQHENVVAIYAVREFNALPYLVMEYVCGKSLQDVLDQEGPLPMPKAAVYGRQIAAGLSAAHARKLIHRDVKPANILVVKETGAIKITDFGLARVADAGRGLSAEGMWIGTPLFMAPEQFAGGAIDHRADLFALGTVLYTLIAGRPPFESETMLGLMNQVCTVKPRSLTQIRPDTPSWLASLIDTLHAKEAASRPAAAADVVRIFEKQIPADWR